MSRSGWHNRNANRAAAYAKQHGIPDEPPPDLGPTPAPKPETPEGQCDFCAHPLADHGKDICGVTLAGPIFCKCPRRSTR